MRVILAVLMALQKILLVAFPHQEGMLIFFQSNGLVTVLSSSEWMFLRPALLEYRRRRQPAGV
jgi:hypothetical protein